MPSKKKKNQRRMRRVALRRALEEQHASTLPTKATPTKNPKASKDKTEAVLPAKDAEAVSETQHGGQTEVVQTSGPATVEQAVTSAPEPDQAPETVVAGEPQKEQAAEAETVKQEPKSIEQVVAGVPKPEPDVLKVPEPVACCMPDPEVVVEAQPAVNVEAEFVDQVVASVPEPEQVAGAEPAIQKVPEKAVCRLPEPEPVDQVIVNAAEGPVVCCIRDPGPVLETESALEVESVDQAVACVPEPEQVAEAEPVTQKVAEHVAACIPDPEPVIKPEPAIKEAAESVEQAASSVPPPATAAKTYVEEVLTIAHESEHASEAESAVQNMVCSTQDPEVETVAQKVVASVHFVVPEMVKAEPVVQVETESAEQVVTSVPETEAPKAESEPSQKVALEEPAAKLGTEPEVPVVGGVTEAAPAEKDETNAEVLVKDVTQVPEEVKEEAATNLKCVEVLSEDTSVPSCQMEMSVEAVLNGHVAPEVSIEG
uniref:proteoglycan 4-like isoform X2 n=1 Tax=Doryrhamphus excisus TaxID=161450 RepID=UPI0025ADE41B|nr:proteoglycan 4-like isoform X2 [Doryrhamphus excisus]